MARRARGAREEERDDGRIYCGVCDDLFAPGDGHRCDGPRGRQVDGMHRAAGLEPAGFEVARSYTQRLREGFRILADDGD